MSLELPWTQGPGPGAQVAEAQLAGMVVVTDAYLSLMAFSHTAACPQQYHGNVLFINCLTWSFLEIWHF